jgi:hypothetical protein
LNLGHTIARVNGILGVARAFGDFELEEYITCVPDVFRLSRDTIEDKYLVVACDGLWDVVEDSMVSYHSSTFSLLFTFHFLFFFSFLSSLLTSYFSDEIFSLYFCTLIQYINIILGYKSYIRLVSRASKRCGRSCEKV